MKSKDGAVPYNEIDFYEIGEIGVTDEIKRYTFGEIDTYVSVEDIYFIKSLKWQYEVYST